MDVHSLFLLSLYAVLLDAFFFSLFTFSSCYSFSSLIITLSSSSFFTYFVLFFLLLSSFFPSSVLYGLMFLFLYCPPLLSSSSFCFLICPLLGILFLALFQFVFLSPDLFFLLNLTTSSCPLAPNMLLSIFYFVIFFLQMPQANVLSVLSILFLYLPSCPHKSNLSPIFFNSILVPLINPPPPTAHQAFHPL